MYTVLKITKLIFSPKDLVDLKISDPIDRHRTVNDINSIIFKINNIVYNYL